MEVDSDDPGYIERRAEYQRRYWEIQARCDADPTLDRKKLCNENAYRWQRQEARILRVTVNRERRERILGRACVICGLEEPVPKYLPTRHGLLFRRLTKDLPAMAVLLRQASEFRFHFHLSSHHYACVCHDCRIRWRSRESQGEARLRKKMKPEQAKELEKQLWYHRFLKANPSFPNRITTLAIPV